MNVGTLTTLLSTLAVLGRNRQLWILTLHWSLLGFAGWAFVTWMPSYLREHFDLTQTKAGFTATAYMQAAALAGVLCGGVWADRWSRRHPRGRVFVPMIALTLASPFVFLSANTDTLWIAAACLVVFGFARGCSDSNMMPILCQVTDPALHQGVVCGCLIMSETLDLQGRARISDFAGHPEMRSDVLTLVLTFL